MLTAQQATLEVGKPVRQFLGFFTYALLGFAAIGVVVGAFIIFNTFTILVTQRTRELGLLRAMGATGGQVVWSVVLEAFVVAAVASVLGLLVGHRPRDRAARSSCATSGSTSPRRRRCCSARTVVVSLAVGVVVTVAAAVLPGAARGPGAAGGRDQRRRAPGPWVAFRRRVIAGLVVIAAGHRGAGLRARPAPTTSTGLVDQVQVVALGAFGVLVGVVMLLATVARPARRAIGAAASACSASAGRSRARTPCATRVAPRSPRRRW